jgi:hypothetical protein
VAVLPEPVMGGRSAEPHAIALRPGVRGRLAFAWRAEGPAGPAARRFVEHTRTVLRARFAA